MEEPRQSPVPGEEERPVRRRVLPFVWGALALVLVGLGALALHACGLRLFGTTLLDFCPGQPAAAAGPPPALLLERERAERLDERLDRLSVELAYADDCPVEEQLAEGEPEPAPEPEPEPQPEPSPEQACRAVPPADRQVDLYLLLDVSGSFTEDLPSISRTVQDLIARAAGGQLAGEVRLGLGSFIDKPQPGYGQLHTYRHHQSLTADFGRVLQALRRLGTSENYDEPEAQLEAMLEAAGQVAFADGAQRIMVVITDDLYHAAGDYPLAPPEDGRPDNDPSNEDYPAVSQVRRALEAAGITPLFLVTSNALSTYRDLARQLGRGIVVPISSSSDNLLQALDRGVEEICGDGLSQ